MFSRRKSTANNDSVPTDTRLPHHSNPARVSDSASPPSNAWVLPGGLDLSSKDYQMPHRNETSRSLAIIASTAGLNRTEIPVELHTGFAADHEVLLA
jgi:hypothetical protein